MATSQQNPPMHADETGQEAWRDNDGQPTGRRRLPGWLSIVLRLLATGGLMAFALRSVEWHKLV
jgi:hypothetical protein